MRENVDSSKEIIQNTLILDSMIILKGLSY